MNDKERQRRFLKARREQAKVAEAIPDSVIKDLIKLLTDAETQILARLAAQPTEWELFHLEQVRASVKSALDEFKRLGDGTLSQGAHKAWYAGQASVDLPLVAGGINVEAILPALNFRQLTATQSFLTSKISEISAQALTKVNSQLGMVLMGIQGPADAVTQLASILETSRSRAQTIVRTELGRVYETAAHERRMQATERLPGLKKQWRRSGRVRSRLTHDAIDGQIREAGEPFNVGGEELMFPRDPNGSAKNTINCGCTSLSYMDSWDVQLPGKKPFTEDELRANPLRRALQDNIDSGS